MGFYNEDRYIKQKNKTIVLIYATDPFRA